jgi:2,4-dienoyl-CoA reductase (NADPH2)
MTSLFAKGKIGNLEIRNRFVMTPMNLAYTPEGGVTDRLIEFYRARAKGGVGLIVVGAVGVDPKRVNTRGVMQLYDDSLVPGYRRLTQAVHNEGARIFPQLWHPGAFARSKEYSGQQAVAPSEVLCVFTREMPRVLAVEEIEEIVAHFGAAARRAKEAGFDGIEIIASAGYLIAQFLSPVTNRRTDRYGGDLTARMTFLMDIIYCIRRHVGPDFPIMVRLAGNDFIDGGNTHDDAVEIANALEKAGVDAIDVTGGWHYTRIPQLTMDVPPGAYTYLAKKIKNAVTLPVVACNRIDLKTADTIIASGSVDFVGIARGFVADADLVNKAQAGQFDLIRPCIGCNQGCMDNVFKEKPLSCLVNPEAGREEELLVRAMMPMERPSEKPEKILVIGAGAAGLEYAKVASAKGNKVTVWEKTERAGGQLHLAGAPPARRDFHLLSRYLYRSCLEGGVEFFFGRNAEAQEVADAATKEGFDRVVVATGSEPVIPQIATGQGAHVVQAWDVLLDKVQIGKNVVIIGGGAVGIEVALKVAEEGTLDAETFKFLFLYRAESPETLYRLLTTGDKKVTIVEMQPHMGKDIGPSSRWIMMGNLKRFGVTQITNTRVLEIKRGGVLVEDHEGVKTVISADTVVLAIGSKPVNALAHALQGKVERISVIGDARKPRKVMDAIHEGYDAAIFPGSGSADCGACPPV